MSNKKTLLLIGAGPTSSLISYLISNNGALSNLIDIHVWEKARGIGGRFSTSRSVKNPDCYVDLGAQYLTRSLNHPSSKMYFDNLKQGGLLRPLEVAGIPGFRVDAKKEHYTCKQGSATIVKHFFQQASISKNDIKFNHRVIRINPLPTGKVEVTTDNKIQSSFDIVISTMPVPQILQLEGVAHLLSDESVKGKLEMVKYSSRYALGVFFDEPKKLSGSSQPINFLEANTTPFRYWSIENLKRNGSFGDPTSVVMHTNIDYGAEHAEDDKEKLKPSLIQEATTIVPEVGSLPGESIKCHKWKYSQVLDAYEAGPGYIKLNEQVFAAGDGFTASGLEGCIDSAERVVSAIQTMLSQ